MPKPKGASAATAAGAAADAKAKPPAAAGAGAGAGKASRSKGDSKKADAGKADAKAHAAAPALKSKGKAKNEKAAAVAAAAAAAGSDDDEGDGKTAAAAAGAAGSGVIVASYSESQDASAPVLLSRDDFRENTFARDGHVCVIPKCGLKAVDAHHIIERKLFKNGGYFLENGASLCNAHHMAVEQTTISCGALRRLCGIRRVVLPDDFDRDGVYDKWGNRVDAPAVAERVRLRDAEPDVDHEATVWGRRPGRMFLLDNVIKVLREGQGVLELFSE